MPHFRAKVYKHLAHGQYSIPDGPPGSLGYSVCNIPTEVENKSFPREQWGLARHFASQDSSSKVGPWKVNPLAATEMNPEELQTLGTFVEGPGKWVPLSLQRHENLLNTVS